MQPVVALLTDFGTADTYVGVMKGVMLGIQPQARFVDLTHAIQPQNVRQAAFSLLTSYRFFPPGTVFLVVVDPGVGTARRSLAIRAGGYLFVGPDNGVFSYVLREWNDAILVEPTEERFQLPGISSTFHGRDIFAPLAAHLAADVPLQAVGLVVTDPVMLPQPALEVGAGRLTGEVVHIDRFGNAVTSVGDLRWQDTLLSLEPRFGSARERVTIRAGTARALVGGRILKGIRRTYSEAEPGEPIALVGSSGFLEIAMNQGNAAASLNMSVGERIGLEFSAS